MLTDSSIAAPFPLDGLSGAIGLSRVVHGMAKVRKEGRELVARPVVVPAIGETVGRFRVERVLGRGGMGIVFRAEDTKLGRPVALKFLLNQGPSGWKRFQKEARLLATLQHPGLAGILEVGDHAGGPYLVIPFIDGTTLEDPAIPLRQRIVAVRDAARALHYVHGRGILHRDLKPSNIMVERGSHRAVVLDFGIAKQFTAASLSVSREVLGTPEYMSPEQLAGEKLDASADVYSLGATLHQVAVGRPPFQHDNLAALLKKIAQEEPACPRRLNPALHQDLATIILKCLEKEPHRRYGSAADLAEDLTAWLEDRPIQARRPSAAYQIRRALSKRRGLLIAAASILLTVSAATGFFSVEANQRFERAAEEARLAFEQRDWAKALAAADLAIAIRPDHELTLLASRSRDRQLAADFENRGVRLLKYRDFKGAAAAYSEALELNPGSLPALIDRSTARLKIKNVSGALADADAAVHLCPESPEAHFVRGMTLFFMGDLDGAIAAYTATLDRDPGRLTALYNRGIAYKRKRDYQAAHRDFDAIVRDDPGNFEALAARGGVLLSLGRPAESIKDFELVLRMAPPAWSGRSLAENFLSKSRAKLAAAE